MTQEPIFSPKFLLVFLSLLTQASVMYLLLTTISEHATTFAATPAVSGLISGIYIFGALCSRFCSGRAMEIIGWKKMAIGASLFHCLICTGYFFANSTVYSWAKFWSSFKCCGNNRAVNFTQKSLCRRVRLFNVGNDFCCWNRSFYRRASI